MIQEIKTTKEVMHTKKIKIYNINVQARDQKFLFCRAISLDVPNFHNQKAITLLSNACAGSLYNHITHVCSQIVIAVKQNLNECSNAYGNK